MNDDVGMKDTKHKKVLIVDDDNGILDIMQEALTHEGYDVKSLPAVDNIFPEIMQYKPDVVILDYLLKGVNGGELCHQIKINRFTAQIPVILMSAYPKVLQSLGNYGSNMFGAKPFDLNHDVDCIETLTANVSHPFDVC